MFGLQSAGVAWFPFMVMKALFSGAGGQKQPQGHVWTVLGWGQQKRSPGWKMVKYNMRAKSYSLVCERSEDRW